MSALERAATAAFAQMYLGLDPASGFELVRVGPAVCGIARPLPGVRDLNRVAGADASTDPEALLRVYDGFGHVVAVAPATGPLAQRLAAAGYTPAYPWMRFARAAEELEPEPRVRVAGPADAAAFAAAVAGGFGMPPLMLPILAATVGRPGWTCLVARLGDRPVAGGALFVDGDQGWLGMGAVLPEARGHGLQGALLRERVRLAALAGCGTVTTETGVREPGRPSFSYANILRAGFEERYELPNWASP